MRRVSLGAAIAWLSVVAGGCSAITGLDSLQTEDCLPNCDGSSSGDSPVFDAPSDKTNGGDVVDSPMGNDVGQETMGMESSTDDASDANDAPTDVTPDVPSDAPGCDSGSLGDADNCTACGVKCGPVSNQVQSRGCSNNTTCAYTCKTGYLDCAPPPDLMGCGCDISGATGTVSCCLNSTCPVKHNNGLGQVTSTFYDCVAQGQYTSLLAQDACISYVGQANKSWCAQYQGCGPDGGVQDQAWCAGMGGNDCVCWTYSGPDKGTYFDPGQQMCLCGTGGMFN